MGSIPIINPVSALGNTAATRQNLKWRLVTGILVLSLDVKRQGPAYEGFRIQNFQIDWDQHQATCPAGKTSSSWAPAIDSRSTAVIKIKCSSSDCTNCLHSQVCVRSVKRVRRALTRRTQAAHEALQAARVREKTAEYKREAMKRAGIKARSPKPSDAVACVALGISDFPKRTNSMGSWRPR